MGYPAYYGRPALVADHRRQTAPAPVRAVVALHYLGALLTLLLAVGVAGIWHGNLQWPAVTGISPELRQVVAQRGPTVAVGLAAVGVIWLAIARKLRRGGRFSRFLVLVLSAVSILGTLYGMVRGYQVNVLAGFTLPVLTVLLLCARSARSWFRWGSY